MNATARHLPGSKLLVGLTGGIGSGKSTASACFESLGIPVIDADVVAREVVTPGTAALATITEHFGSDCLLLSGELDRAALRRRVFADPDERKWLEALLHPLIRAAIARQLADAVARPAVPYAILSSPLLMETGQDVLVHRVLVMDVDESLQRERTLRRDGSDAHTVDAIIATQWQREKRRNRADDVIVNAGSLQELHASVCALDERYRCLSTALTSKKGPP